MTYRKLARPTLMWVCIPLLPAAVLMPSVGADKLVPLIGLVAALYGIREWGKAKGND